MSTDTLSAITRFSSLCCSPVESKPSCMHEKHPMLSSVRPPTWPSRQVSHWPTSIHHCCCWLQVTAANKGIAAGWSGRIATDCTAAGATAVSFSTRTASAGASSSRQAAGASADAGSSSMAGALTSTAAAAAAAEHSTTMGASKTWLLPRQAGDREAGGGHSALAPVSFAAPSRRWLAWCPLAPASATHSNACFISGSP